MLDLNYSEYFSHEHEENPECDIRALASSRLEDLVDQIWDLLEQGQTKDAVLLFKEGLELAEAIDNGYLFFFARDLVS